MAATAQAARRVITAWIATEVLAAQTVRAGWNEFAAEKQGQQRNRAISLEDGAAFWEAPHEADAAPWSLRDMPLSQGLPAEDERFPSWYSVVLGALPAREAFRRLDDAFGDETDEDRVSRKQEGYVIAATVILDETGIMVPDSLAIASFAWGFGRVLTEGTSAELATWTKEERRLEQLFGDRLSPTGAGGKPRPLT